MKKFLFIIGMIAMFVLGACSVVSVSAEQNNPVKIWTQNTNGHYHTFIVVDESTGVNYIVVSNSNQNRLDSVSISITPRLNADGTLYTSK